MCSSSLVFLLLPLAALPSSLSLSSVSLFLALLVSLSLSLFVSFISLFSALLPFCADAFSGAAAAAAGRGSPPPPRRGEAMHSPGLRSGAVDLVLLLDD